MLDLYQIDTEKKNTKSATIDCLTTIDVLRLINDEDKKVAFAVEKELEHIATAVDLIYSQLKQGGRLIYVGAGTSGRLGILDAVECPPTFGVSSDLIVGLIAGGYSAIIQAVEGAEDRMELGKEDLQRLNFTSQDIMVGIAASGRTPYVLGAIQYAKSIGAKTISVSCSTEGILNKECDIAIVPLPGAEVITGSTRLKSGTAQKMVLNMISTSVMIKLGKVYGNLMVDVQASNSKLLQRAVSIVVEVTGVEEALAKQVLGQCNYSAKKAIVMILCNMGPEEASQALEGADGHIGRIICSH